MAYGYSVLCYPLFSPTILAVVYCLLYKTHSTEDLSLGSYSPVYWWVLVSCTMLFTCIIPLVLLLIMRHLGQITDLDVSNPEQRHEPYIFTLVSMSCWCVCLHALHVPPFLFWSAAASVLSLFAVTFITPYWKISAHLTAFGGSTAMLLGILWFFGLPCSFAISLLAILAWLLMLARIYLEAHTPVQVVCGYLLGLTTVLIPNMLL